MSLVAKPVIDKQFWILQENNNKVGNIEACDGGYQVKINNQIVAQYKTIKLQQLPVYTKTVTKAKVGLLQVGIMSRKVAKWKAVSGAQTNYTTTISLPRTILYSRGN
jgi:hypothetical protein